MTPDTTTPTARLCIDCLYCIVPYTFHPGELGGWHERHYERSVCGLTPDRVTGSGDNRRLCAEERSDTRAAACGPEGKYWESRPIPPPRAPKPKSWLQRLFP